MTTRKRTVDHRPLVGYKTKGKLFKPARGKSIADTATVHPLAVANGVAEDVNSHFGKDVLTRKHVARLVAHAEMIYANNPKFHDELRSAEAREVLWSFMQHWAAAMLLREMPEYGRDLPHSYLEGVPLWKARR